MSIFGDIEESVDADEVDWLEEVVDVLEVNDVVADDIDVVGGGVVETAVKDCGNEVELVAVADVDTDDSTEHTAA